MEHRGGQLNPLNQFSPYNTTVNPIRVLNPFFVLRRNALYRGLFGGSKRWLVVGAIVWTPRLLRRAMGRHPERVSIDPMWSPSTRRSPTCAAAWPTPRSVSERWRSGCSRPRASSPTPCRRTRS